MQAPADSLKAIVSDVALSQHQWNISATKFIYQLSVQGK
jgi:hypothetical protein